MSTNAALLKPFKPRQVRPRRIPCHFDCQIPRLWFRHSLIMTQLLNGTNLFLPAFEAYMVKTIQTEWRSLPDPALQSQVRGLLGQEQNHSQAHQQYNEILCHLLAPAPPSMKRL